MSEIEMNSYRFLSGEEPGDERLAQLMREVAYEAAESHRKVTQERFLQMRRNARAKRQEWSSRINSVLNG